MCYYDLTRWKCGFWRWGQFREHCQVYSPELDACAQRSMLIWQTHEDQEDCKLCKSIEKKQRKTERLGDAIGLWQQKNGEQSAEAIEKAQREIVEAANTICALQERHSMETFGIWKGNRDLTDIKDDTSAQQPDNKDEVATSGARQDNTTIRFSNGIVPDLVWTDSPTKEHYTVAILCALSKELKAVRMLFDQGYQVREIALEDTNSYACGRIGPHNVVTASLPSATYGTNAAADVAVNLRRSFPSIRFCLLVGIGGGVPSPQHDIRLGDIVVGEPAGMLPGVVQYDFGKSLQGGIFQVTGSLNRPPNVLLTAISNLKSDPRLPKSPLAPMLDIMARLDSDYGHPGQHNDPLTMVKCSSCNAGELCVDVASHLPRREHRKRDHPDVHYGIIASGNRVIKSAADRDRLARDYDVLCFEMEAAGIVNTFPCLVIRGVCDYADSSKDKKWQEYAAATAAAYAKLLLDYVRASS